MKTLFLALLLFAASAARAQTQIQLGPPRKQVKGILDLPNGGTNQNTWIASRCVQVKSDGTQLESAAAPCGTGSGGGSGNALSCAADASGNVGYTNDALTKYIEAHWLYATGQTAIVTCVGTVPSGSTSATVTLTIADADSTAGHTATYDVCHATYAPGASKDVDPTGTCIGAQTYTTTATAYQTVVKTFSFSATAGNWIVVQIKSATVGTPPSGNMQVQFGFSF